MVSDTTDGGRVGKPTGLSQAEPCGLGPPGFDPSRGAQRREEARALLPFFTDKWEPLRDILQRAGDHRSASQMVSRARGKVLAGANFEPGARKIRDLKRRAALLQKGER